jgi:hypothetical protein
VCTPLVSLPTATAATRFSSLFTTLDSTFTTGFTAAFGTTVFATTFSTGFATTPFPFPGTTNRCPGEIRSGSIPLFAFSNSPTVTPFRLATFASVSPSFTVCPLSATAVTLTTGTAATRIIVFQRCKTVFML